jgi:autophagy-related protein 9
MMASNILSRLLPTNPQGRSIYDEIRAHDEASDPDLEERAGMSLDEENLGFPAHELGNPAEVFDAESTTESTAFLPDPHQTPMKPRFDKKGKGRDLGRLLAESPRLLEEDPDDDVPASLLIEGNDHRGPITPNQARVRHTSSQKRAAPIPGSSTRENRVLWEATQTQQKLHRDAEAGTTASSSRQPSYQPTRVLTGSPREKAMWRWINVRNLDKFIKAVYAYYEGDGIWCIILDKVINILYVYHSEVTQVTNYYQHTYFRSSIYDFSHTMYRLQENTPRTCPQLEGGVSAAVYEEDIGNA